jgi:hypothetical protein
MLKKALEGILLSVPEIAQGKGRSRFQVRCQLLKNTSPDMGKPTRGGKPSVKKKSKK